jgi:hypothetical protein
MTFTPFDALILFICVSTLVAAFAYVSLRFKIDLVTWAVLVAGSLPPTVYFTVRVGGDLTTVIEAVSALAAGWAFFLLAMWVRSKAYEAIYSSARRDAITKPSAPVVAALQGGSNGPQSDAPGTPAPSGAYLLIGFGGSLAAASGFVLFMLFAPGRHGPPLIAFRPDNPAFQLCGVGLVIGLALLGVGRWLMRAPRRGVRFRT